MPWIVSDDVNNPGEEFLRKLPAGRHKWVDLDECTVFRTKKLALKEAERFTECFDVQTGETLDYEIYWGRYREHLGNGEDPKQFVGRRPSRTIRLNKIEYRVVQTKLVNK